MFDRWIVVCRGRDATTVPTSRTLPTTEQSKRVATIFHRKLTTPWSSREIRAYKALGAVPEEDLAAVERYYASNWPPDRNANILRHDLLTFLNNFPGELDRAHNPAPTRPRVNGHASSGTRDAKGQRPGEILTDVDMSKVKRFTIPATP